MQADTYLEVGETIRPVRRDGDRRGYVIAVGDTPDEAVRARRRCRGAPDRRGGRVSCSFDLEHYREILEAASPAATASPGSAGPERGDLFLRHDIDLSLEAAVAMAELEAELGVQATYLLMTESVFYNLASPEGVVGDRAPARARARRRAARRASERRPRRALRPGRLLAQPEARVHVRRDSRRGQRLRRALLLARDIPLGLEPALAVGLSSRGAARRARSRGSRSSSTRRSGSIRERRWVRRCGRCSKPTKHARLAQLAEDDIDLA